MRYAKEEKRDKSQCQMKIKTAILSSLTCPQPTLQTSPLPLLPASPLIWTLPSLSQSGCTLRPQWSTAKSPSPFLLPSQQSLWNSVSSNSPLSQCVLLSKDTGHQAERNSSSLHKDWWELCEKIKRLAMTTKNNLRSSNNKAKIWQNKRRMRLAWKKPTNIGWKTLTRETRSGRGEDKCPKDMRKMKGMSLTSSSPSPMVTTPCTYLPPISKWTDYTAWVPSASTNPSTDTSSSHHNTSPSKKRESSLTGSLQVLPMTPCTLQCTITPGPRKTGESQLSSSTTMTCILKLLPWSQSKGAWPLPSRQLRSNWIKASNACSAPTHTSSTSYSVPFTRAPTSTPSPRGGSPPFPEAHTMVGLDPDQRVMSQGSLQEGKRTAKGEE